MPKKRNTQTKTRPTYDVGDLVAAKLKGYPFWPAQIKSINVLGPNKIKYEIWFFGTHDTCTSNVELKPFTELTEKERANNKPNFQKALSECQKIFDSECKGEKRKQHEKETDDNGEQDVEVKTPNKKRRDVDTASTDEKHENPKASSKKLQIDEGPVPEDKNLVSKTPNKRRKDSNPPVPEPQATEAKVPSKRRRLDHRASANIKIEPEEKKIKLDETLISTNDLKSDNDTSEKCFESEGENHIQVSEQQSAIDKLKKKIAEKEKEKEERKQTLKEERLYAKVSKLLPVIQTSLDRLSRVSEQLSVSKANIVQWNKAVQNYKKCISFLEKCIEFFMTARGQKKDEREKCRNTLSQIVENLKAVRKQKTAPPAIIVEVKGILKGMKRNTAVKDFINGSVSQNNSKIAMIERKENDRVK